MARIARQRKISQVAYPDYLSKFILKEGYKEPTPQNTIPNFRLFAHNASSCAPSPKVSLKINGFYDLAYSAAMYYNLIENSQNTDSNKSVFVSIDESLNSTGICVSIPILLEDDKEIFNSSTMRAMYAMMNSASVALSSTYANNKNYSKFGHAMVTTLETFFRDKLIEAEENMLDKLLNKPIKNHVIRNLINTNVNYQNILARLLSFSDMYFDASNRRICMLFNLVPPKDDNANIYKLLFTSTAIKIIITGIVPIFNTMLEIGKNLGVNAIRGYDINQMSDGPEEGCVYFIMPKDKDKIREITDKFDGVDEEDLTEAVDSIRKFIFDVPNCNYIFTIEEVAAATNFMGISRTAMSFGAIANTVADIYLNDQFRRNSPNRKQNFFFVTNKQNLESFLRKKFKMHKEEAELIEATVSRLFKITSNDSKKMSLVVSSMYSGFIPKNDDVADAYCHCLFAISMYQYLVALINTLMKNEAFVVREYDDYHKTRIIVDSFGFYNDKGSKNDIAKTCKAIEASFNLVNSLYGNRLSIDPKMVAKYLSKNISSQFARYLNDLNEERQRRLAFELEGNKELTYVEIPFGDLQQLKFSSNISYDKLVESIESNLEIFDDTAEIPDEDSSEEIDMDEVFEEDTEPNEAIIFDEDEGDE